jgi:preprotein translocase subunit SecD
MKRISTSIIAVMLLGSSLALSAETQSLTFNPVTSQSLLTREDFRNAQVVIKKGKVMLEATLTDSGAMKLKDYSSNHVGERLAIISEGEVIAAPVMRASMSRRIEVDALNEAQAKNLANLINGRN